MAEIPRFRTLKARADPAEAQAYDALHEGIPEWMEASVIDWLQRGLQHPAGGVDDEKVREIERTLRVRADWRTELTAADSLMERALEDHEFCLELINFQLYKLTWPDGETGILRLIKVLNDAGSAWKVSTLNDSEVRSELRWALFRRVEQTVEAAAKKAMIHGKSGIHLRTAWNGVYGRSPNPSEAYGEAIKAVEVAAGRVIVPNDLSATLGKRLGEWKSNERNFTIPLVGAGDSAPGQKADVSGITIARLMTQLLWTSQHDRHGTFDPSAPISVTQQEAEAAVMLAALLVHWFETGVISAR